ncbi:ANTAR domain-containing protein [Nocardioides humilatus]|uniref:ANTAR domain-containing protein n=1 Tax=Nocardioides humilatus TaxID=2607660 RepID=A0A5B1L6U0_9ACTN|nr:ANTAR domain-containing protein [Nocardioides humilatus]
MPRVRAHAASGVPPSPRHDTDGLPAPGAARPCPARPHRLGPVGRDRRRCRGPLGIRRRESLQRAVPRNLRGVARRHPEARLTGRDISTAFSEHDRAFRAVPRLRRAALNAAVLDEAECTGHDRATEDLRAALADAVRTADQLQDGLLSNRTIGKALGLLMAQYHLDDEAAFDKLRDHSRDLNLKIRDLAQRIVDHHNSGCRSAD